MPFVELVALPLGSVRMQRGQACPGECGSACRQKQLYAFDPNAVVLGLPARIQPQDGEGKRRINGPLGLLLIHTQDGKGGTPLAQDAARIYGAEGALEVHCVAQFRDGVAGKDACQRSPQVLLIGRPGNSPSGRGAVIPSPADLELRWPRLSELLHHKPQVAIADFRVQHSADSISFRRPQVQQALVVFSRDGVLRICQVEYPGAIFEHQRVAGAA